MNTKDIRDCVLLEPKFLRIPDAVQYSGICRTELYRHLSAGTIKSKVLRKPGNIRGIRLISVESLDAFLASLPDDLPEGGGR